MQLRLESCDTRDIRNAYNNTQVQHVLNKHSQVKYKSQQQVLTNN